MQPINRKNNQGGRIDSLGRFFSLITKVNERVVVLSCFGELELFDEIALTLGSSE